MSNVTCLHGAPGNVYPQCPETVEGLVQWLKEKKLKRWGSNPSPGDHPEDNLIAQLNRIPEETWKASIQALWSMTHGD